MYKTTVYFEIAPEARIAFDENGQPASCGCKFALNHEKPMTDDYRPEFVEIVKRYLAEQWGADPQFLREVPEDYYLENYEEDPNAEPEVEKYPYADEE